LKWLDGCEEGWAVAGCGSEDFEVFEDFEDLFLRAEGRKGFIFIFTPIISNFKPSIVMKSNISLIVGWEKKCQMHVMM
jgi:hypothetical protein